MKPTAITRCSNWPRALAKFVDARRSRVFAYGTHDCSLFVADWVQVLTGVDPAEQFRGRYASEAEAKALLRPAAGLERLAGRLCRELRWPSVPVAQARRGDVVLLRGERGPSLGICVGGLAVFAGPNGLVFRPIKECRRAWRVG